LAHISSCYEFGWHGDGAGNTIEENTSVYALVAVNNGKCAINFVEQNAPVFSEHELLSLSIYRLFVCLSSVAFLRPTQAVQIFRNISTTLGTLAIH